MLELIRTTQFKKDCRRMMKRGCDLDKLDVTVDLLCCGERLPGIYHDHPLHGQDNDCRECHIEPDWPLEYKVDKDALVLVAMRTGSHSDLRFG